MSTDDSISEDVSSSAALGHENVEENDGKESEASIISSEDSPSGLPGPEEEQAPVRSVRTLQGFIQTSTGGLKKQAKFSSGHKSRSLCLSAGNEFISGRSLLSINPSPLQTLTALVQEIQKTGQTDPEVWKDSEGRWLQLFQLLEKQYQAQIVAQQEQHQCQIQLIQDEIKALVQLQARPHGPHSTENLQAPTPVGSPILDLLGGVPGSVPHPASPKQTVAKPLEPPNTEGAAAALLLSSGYGTLSASELSSSRDLGASRDDDGPPLSHPACEPDSGAKPHGSLPGDVLTGMPPPSLPSNPSPPPDQLKPSSRMTTWALKLKGRHWRSRSSAQSDRLKQGRPSQGVQLGVLEQTSCEGSTGVHEDDSLDSQHQPAFQASQAFCLRRSDSLASEVSGLTYWKLEDNELYHPLPDTLGMGSSHLMQENSGSLTPSEEPTLPASLREIYRSRRGEEAKGHNWETSPNSSTTSVQVFNLDLGKVHAWSSGRKAASASPPLLARTPSPLPGSTAISPDSMVEGVAGQKVTDTDGGSVVTPIGPSPGTHSLASPLKMDTLEPSPAATSRQRTSSLDDPFILSLVRQNVREKTSRHIADLRAYYESEMHVLKRKLDLAKQPSSLDLNKVNQSLLDRCQHLENALMEANARIQDLENKNHSLEQQLADWPSRYEAACGVARCLQQHLDDVQHGEREKEAASARLRAQLSQAEGALLVARKDADEKDGQLRKERRMLQDLVADYEALHKEHLRVKDSLASAEDRLFETSTEISELRRVVSKLDTQIKQLEYENIKGRHVTRSQSQPSGAGFHQHPDHLLSPREGSSDAEGAHKKCPGLGVEQPSEQDSQDRQVLHGATGTQSPPEREAPQVRLPAQEPEAKEPALTPLIRALIHMDEAKATEGHALCKIDNSGPAPAHMELGTRRPMVSFVQGHRWGPTSEWSTALRRAPRSLSPEGLRSSSLPPCTSRNSQASLPARRETLIAPLSVKSSPKRCPTENFSTAFSHSPSWLYHSNPRSKRRLQFVSSDQVEENSQSRNGGLDRDARTEPSEGPLRESWETPGDEGNPGEALLGPCDTPLSQQPRLQSLADTERLFDELTQEKQQIEAALSRIPAAGGRVTLQAKLDEEALEERLEKINHDLGSIRMTLKRFHVLRSSSNI